jgi:ketosteroid isomerase-like protein
MQVIEQSVVDARNHILQYGIYLNEGNIDEILKLYAVDAEIIPEEKQSISNKDNIKEFYIETFKTIKLTGELLVKEAKVYDNIALVRCEEFATMEVLETGFTQKAFFRELFVLKRDSENKSWEILKYMFSHI